MTRELPPGSQDGSRRPAFRMEDGPAARVVEARSRRSGGDRRAEEEIGLDEVWAVLRRRWGWIAAAVALALAAGAWWTVAQPPVWQASATVRVEDGGGRLGDEESALLLGRPSSQIETEMRVLETRPMREEVVRRLDLTVRVEEPAGLPRDVLLASVSASSSVPSARYRLDHEGRDRWRLARLPAGGAPAGREVAAGDTVEVEGASFVLASDSAMREAGVELPERATVATVPLEAAVAALETELSVSRPDPEARLVRVRHRGTDRYRVRNVANTLTDVFLERRQRVRSSEARSTVAFLEEQTARIEKQLEAAEEELQAFREQEQVVAPEAQAEAQVERRAELQARRAELASERDALSELVRGLEGGGGRVERLATFPTFLGNETVQDLFQSLIEARQRKTEMLQGRTEKHPDVVTVTERIGRLEDQLAAVGSDYLASLNSEIAALDARLARFGSELEEVPGREVQFARLERRAELLTELHTTLQKRLKEAEVREAVEDPSIRVVEAAVLPEEPVSPRPVRNMTFAGFLGLVLGVGLAFVREYTDRSIRSDDEVDRLLGTPLLSRIPRVPDAEEEYPRRNGLVTARHGDSLPAESYRTLRTNVRYTRAGEGAREMVVTSPGARDGKSITASNLAITFAQQGLLTLLVDADMRRSVQHDAFDVERDPGLADYLADGADLPGVTRRTGVDDLRLVPSGARPPNPAELLDSPRMEEFLAEARDRFDALVVDTPPTLVVTDASVVGPHLEGVLLVVRADQTDREAAVDAMLQLRRVGCDVLGVVLNDASPEGRYAYGSDYYEYYGEDEGRGGSGLGRLLPFG